LALGAALSMIPTGPLSAAAMKGELSTPEATTLYYFRFRGAAEGGRLDVQQFRLRYVLSTLLGEPLISSGARYDLGDFVELNTPGGGVLRIERAAYLPGDWIVTSGDPPNKIEVSPAVFDLIRITSFTFKAKPASCLTGQGAFCTLKRYYGGTLAPSGEWGWGSPGSPNWKRLFVDVPSDTFAPAEVAKETWRKMFAASCTAAPKAQSGAIWGRNALHLPLSGKLLANVRIGRGRGAEEVRRSRRHGGDNRLQLQRSQGRGLRYIQLQGGRAVGERWLQGRPRRSRHLRASRRYRLAARPYSQTRARGARDALPRFA